MHIILPVVAIVGTWLGLEWLAVLAVAVYAIYLMTHRGTLNNLMLTMLLGGLWHGASWSFMLWGGLHGAYLMIHRGWSMLPLAKTLRESSGGTGILWKAICWLLTFHAVCIAWAFFRLTSPVQSIASIKQWFVFDFSTMMKGDAWDISILALLAVYAVFVAAELACKRWRLHERVTRGPVTHPFLQGLAWGISVVLVILAIILAPSGEAPAFIYFQF